MAQNSSKAIDRRAIDCWVVSDGRPGNENQALGLAEALSRLMPLRIALKRFRVKGPWRSLPRELWGDPFARLSPGAALLRPPFPPLWIACGRLSTPFTLAVKKRSPSTFTIQIQRPRAPAGAFDLVVPPRHDRLEGANVIPITGSPNRVTQEILAAEAADIAPSLAALPSPRIAVLIGGPNRVYAITPRRRAELAAELRSLAEQGAGLMITPSRRSDAATIKEVSVALEGFPHFLWDGAPIGSLANPYFGLLGLADHVLVTEDSVNMAADAAMTGKPVHILALTRSPFAAGVTKFARFHSDLRERGIARPFAGQLDEWSYQPLDETARAAAEIKRRFALRDALSPSS